MQAAFPVRDSQVAAFFEHLPGARGMVCAALAGMGQIWADSPKNPRGAVLAVGDFLYCGGHAGPSAARLLRTALAGHRDARLIYAPDGWKAALDRVAPSAHQTRYAFDPEVQPEDARLLSLLAHAPKALSFVPIEGEYIRQCRAEDWSRDFVSLFTDEQFIRFGLGVLALRNGKAVAGASSYVAYPGGLEIQVQTREGFEGHGFATLAAARLILTAHEHSLAAHWDAANPVSRHIAEKLGYRFTSEYTVWKTTP